MKIEIKKMWHLKTTTMPVIIGALGMIKKETDNYIKKISESLNLYGIQKMHLAKLIVSLREYYNMTEKSHPKKGSKKYEYIECI